MVSNSFAHLFDGQTLSWFGCEVDFYSMDIFSLSLMP